MNKIQAKELLDSFHQYIHDEYGKTLVTGMKEDFLDWRYAKDKNMTISDIVDSASNCWCVGYFGSNVNCPVCYPIQLNR